MSVNLYTSSIYLRSIFIIALNDNFALWEFSFAFGNMRGVSSHPPSLGHLTVTVVSTVFHPSVNYLLTGMVHQNQYAPSQSESLHSTQIRSICLFDCFPDLVTGVTLLNIHLIVSFIFIQVICFFDSVHCSVHSLIG